MKRLWLALMAWSSFALAQLPDVDAYLTAGTLEAGEKALSEKLLQNPTDDQLRFGLALLRFLEGIESMVQSWHRYGLQPEQEMAAFIPFLRLPTPVNTNPETISYQDFRAVFEALVTKLSEVEANLAAITDPEVRLPIRFGLIRLDLDADGLATEDELFWRIFTRYNRQAASLELKEENKAFHIVLDKGDVHWLRGYCHLLLALAETYLAYDSQELFEKTAQLFFPKVTSPYAYLQQEPAIEAGGFDMAIIADAVAVMHLLNLKPLEPERMQHALAHLEAVIRESRLSWEAIAGETDNEREWIPNAQQTSVMPIRVDEAMIEGWQQFLKEAERILKGEVLVPHWRVTDGRGINLRRVFSEAGPLDLVQWFQGSAALPYLEEGTLTDGATWRQLQDLFGGNFIGFALWFN
jgi:hypothetical protein